MDTTTNLNYIATGLTAGTTYEFKIEARNQYDYSSFSDTLSLLCATVPESPTNIVTEMEATRVKISWTESTDNGSPITGFKIYVKEIGQSGAYTLEDVGCSPQSVTILLNKFCYIDLTTLLAIPYNVDGGDSVYAKVSAVNFYGESALSVEGNGAYYTREPDSPIQVLEDVTGKTSTTINLVWQDGSNNGGEPI